MSNVFVLIDRARGEVSEAALGLLTLARQWGEPVAVIPGARASDDAAGPGDVDLDPSALAALSKAGAAEIIVARPSGPPFGDSGTVPAAGLGVDAVSAVLAERQAGSEPVGAVLVSGTPEGREIAGRLAVRLGAGAVTDVVALLPTDQGPGVRVKKAALADVFEVTVRNTTRMTVIAVAPEAASAAWTKVSESANPSGGVPPVRTVVLAARVGTSDIRVVERRARDTAGRPDLSKATIVIAGGRGTRGDFTPIEALADTLGGAVGASWAAVTAGWCEHDRQVGQTGQRVSPRLYVAAGISGSVHHRVGMQDSHIVVAVNKDPEAPIFGIADFGIVGDLFTVLPQAVEEIARLRGKVHPGTGEAS